MNFFIIVASIFKNCEANLKRYDVFGNTRNYLLIYYQIYW